MELSQIFDIFPDFSKWVEKKKLSLADLTILTEFQNNSSLKPLIHWIENTQPTHSQGVQILELAGELLLMEKSLDQLFIKNKEASLMIKELKRLRQPMSTARDEKNSKLIKSLDWANSITASWIRKNDKGALHVQFDSFSLKDFEKKIQNLNSIYLQLNKKSENLWTK